MKIGTLTTHGPYLKVLVYGLTGKGKTHFAGTSLDVDILRPVLYLNTDGGQLTLLDRADDAGLIQVIPDTFIEARQIVASLRTKVKYASFRDGIMSATGMDLPFGFRTLIVDDLSSLYWLALERVIQQAVVKKSSHDDDIAELRDYQRARIWFHRLLNEMRALPMHVITTAKAERVRDESSGKLIVQPLIAGKLSQEVGAFFDLVGYLTSSISKKPEGGIIRKIHWEMGDRADAKERLGLSGTFLQNPTIAKIFEKSSRLQTLLNKQQGE